MACTDRITGKNTYIEFNSQALNADYRDFNPSEEIDTVEMSAGDDTNKCYTTSMIDGTASYTGLHDTTTAETILTACALGTASDLIWGWEGNASGKVSRTVNAIVTKIDHKSAPTDAIEVNIEWQFSGAVTKGTFS